MIEAWKCVAFVMAFLSFGMALYFWLKSKMIKNTSSIFFLSKEETQHVLDADADHYYETFNKVDLKLRKSKNIKDYKKKIGNSGSDGTEEAKEKITKCIENMHKKIETRRDEIVDGIPLGKLMDIQWRIGFVGDDAYENGLPHTRGDVIILNNKNIQRINMEEMTTMLVHEKIHVYQKKHASDFSKHLEKDFTKTKKKQSQTRPANPDADEFEYKRKGDGKVLKGTYNKNPTSFRDITFTENDHTLEHPSEMIAYKLESLLSSSVTT